MRFFRPVAGCLVVALVAGDGAVRAEEDFPIVGSYTQNVPCKGDGSDPADLRVTISAKEIVSPVGICKFLSFTREGESIHAQVECQFAGGPLMGDVVFTMRPDGTVEFIDRDKTYSAVLHRCPN